MPRPTIILTRSDDDNARIARQLEGRGLDVRSAPMIELRPIEHSTEELDRYAAEVRESTVLLTSAHATRRWLELRRSAFADDAPANYLVVGSSSSKLLAEDDPTVPIIAVVDAAADIASVVTSVVSSAVRTVVYPCSRARRDEGIDLLHSRGVDVLELPLYEPVMPADAGPRLRAALADSVPPRAFVFYSPSAVANWFSLLSDIPPDSIFLAIGPTTAESLRANGVEEIETIGGGDAASLIGAIERSLARRA